MAADNKEQIYADWPSIKSKQVKISLEKSPYLSAYVANNILSILTQEDTLRGKARTPIDVAKELKEAGIDLLQFDVLQSNELDRRLKRSFGYLFLVLTVLFTAASYAIVICNAINGWRIPEAAITALIIETPMQFIGLLYIVARNLFPQGKSRTSEYR